VNQPIRLAPGITSQAGWKAADLTTAGAEHGPEDGASTYHELEKLLAERTRELEQTQRRMQEALAVRDEFLALMSHELRNPLAVILGNARLMLRKPQRLSRGDRQTALEDVAVEAERLERIVQNLMVLSRLQGQAPAATENIALPVLLHRIAVDLEVHWPQRVFRTRWDDNLPLVRCVPAYIEQVLSILAANAVKYSPAQEPVELAAFVLEGNVVISVRDNGPGISAGDLPMFPQAFRGDEPALQARAGAGIGLTVCQRLMHVQGGSIWVEQHDGPGAEFRLSLPIAV